VSAVSLREVAAAADVHPSLIARYVGTRDDLISAVFEDLTVSLAHEVIDRPLQQISFERQSVMGRWTVMLTYFSMARPGEVPPSAHFNPVLGLAQVVMESYGQDERSARLRGAQIVASALGWRIFEEYLIKAGALDDFDRQVLRDDLTAAHRKLGATPWPSPPDPRPRRKRRH
jgi:AcrR family transcriptional regulator